MTDTLLFWEESLPSLLNGLSLSLQVTGLSLLLGIPLGLIFALSSRSRHRLLRLPVIGLIEIGRGAPALILLQLFYFGLPSVNLSLSSFYAAALALAYCTAAYTSEIIRAGLEAVPAGQREAAITIGLSPLDALRFIILPQGLRVALPALLGFSILILQSTALCFTIALPEIVSQASMIGSVTFRYMSILVLTGLLFACVCIPATFLVSALEKHLGKYAT